MDDEDAKNMVDIMESKKPNTFNCDECKHRVKPYTYCELFQEYYGFSGRLFVCIKTFGE